MAIKLLKFIDRVLGTELSGNTNFADNNAKSDIQLFNSALNNEGNVDKTKITNKNERIAMYAQLDSICAEYRMDMELLKEKKFLEQICGKPVESLSKKEKELLMSSIEATLHRDWKAFWKDRDGQDIDDIIKCAKEQYNREQVDATWVGQKWNDLTTEKTLQEELVDAGIIDKNTKLSSLSDEEFKLKVREYVNKEFIGDLSDASNPKKQRRYERAVKQFVYFVNKFQTTKEKELMTAAIDEMGSDSKAKLVEILVNSCGLDIKARQAVAKSAYVEIDTTRKDALNRTMDNAENFYYTAYSNMSKEDATQALKTASSNAEQFMSCHCQEINGILDKKARGVKLTDAEQALFVRYQNTIVAQNAGAVAGIPQNCDYTPDEASQTVASILDTAKKLGIDSDVLDVVADMVAENPEKFVNMPVEKFTKLLDDVTEGKYSEIVSNKKYKTGYKTSANKKKIIESQVEEKQLKGKAEISSEDNVKTAKSKSVSLKEDALETQVASAPEELTANKKKRKVFVNSSNANKARKLYRSRKIENNNTEVYITKSNDFETYIKVAGKTDGYIEYAADHGKKEALVEAIANMDITNETVVEKDYKQQNVARQFDIIKGCGTDLDKPLEWAKDATIAKLDGEILNCYYATKKAEEAFENLNEKQA